MKRNSLFLLPIVLFLLFQSCEEKRPAYLNIPADAIGVISFDMKSLLSKGKVINIFQSQVAQFILGQFSPDAKEQLELFLKGEADFGLDLTQKVHVFSTDVTHQGSGIVLPLRDVDEWEQFLEALLAELQLNAPIYEAEGYRSLQIEGIQALIAWTNQSVVMTSDVEALDKSVLELFTQSEEESLLKDDLFRASRAKSSDVTLWGSTDLLVDESSFPVSIIGDESFVVSFAFEQGKALLDLKTSNVLECDSLSGISNEILRLIPSMTIGSFSLTPCVMNYATVNLENILSALGHQGYEFIAPLKEVLTGELVVSLEGVTREMIKRQGNRYVPPRIEDGKYVPGSYMKSATEEVVLPVLTGVIGTRKNALSKYLRFTKLLEDGVYLFTWKDFSLYIIPMESFTVFTTKKELVEEIKTGELAKNMTNSDHGRIIQENLASLYVDVSALVELTEAFQTGMINTSVLSRGIQDMRLKLSNGRSVLEVVFVDQSKNSLEQILKGLLDAPMKSYSN